MESVTSHDLYPLPCHKLPHFLRPPPPWSMTYFMDGPLFLYLHIKICLLVFLSAFAFREETIKEIGPCLKRIKSLFSIWSNDELLYTIQDILVVSSKTDEKHQFLRVIASPVQPESC